MRARILPLLLLSLAACAKTPVSPTGDLVLTLDLQPAIDAGIVPDRVLAEARGYPDHVSIELSIDSSQASGTLAGLYAGDYELRVLVHADIPAYAAGEKSVTVREGDSTTLPVDFVDWQDVYPEFPRSVLFIGNSLTGANGGLAAHFAPMAVGAWPFLETSADQIAYGGYSLAAHWDNEPSASREAIATGDYDWVVLQGSPSGMVNNPGDYERYAGYFAAAIESAGGRTALLVPQSYQGEDEYIEYLQATCAAAAEDTGARIVPASQAWYDCLATHPDIELFRDHVHPTEAGTYLYLCVLYATLLQGHPGEAGYDMDSAVPQEEREQIEDSVWATVREHFGW